MAGADQLIEISADVKRLLDKQRHEDESYNNLLRRVLIRSDRNRRPSFSWQPEKPSEKQRERGKMPKRVRGKKRD